MTSDAGSRPVTVLRPGFRSDVSVHVGFGFAGAAVGFVLAFGLRWLGVGGGVVSVAVPAMALLGGGLVVLSWWRTTLRLEPDDLVLTRLFRGTRRMPWSQIRVVTLMDERDGETKELTHRRPVVRLRAGDVVPLPVAFAAPPGPHRLLSMRRHDVEEEETLRREFARHEIPLRQVSPL